MKSSGLGADSPAAARIGKNYQASGHVVLIVNTDRFFLTHRSSWAVALKAAGAEVTLIAEDTGYSGRVRDLGISFIRAPFGREQIGIFQAISAGAIVLWFLLRHKPKIVFMVATAAYTLGWPSALILRRTHFIRVIAGAGRVLSAGRKSHVRSAVEWALRASSRLPNVSTVFQTPDDHTRFLASGWARESRSITIPGTGIDVDTWKANENRAPSKQLVVLFASRLFGEKGIYEFVELARQFRSSNNRFVVVGRPDEGVSTSVTPAELNEWITEGCIDYLGESDDMISVYQESDIFVFPSRHPEGTPRVLIEAAACGLTLVASDQSGCRVIVRDGETGRIFDPQDSNSVMKTFASVLEDNAGRRRMSSAARSLIVQQYSLDVTLGRLFDFVGVAKTGGHRVNVNEGQDGY